MDTRGEARARLWRTSGPLQNTVIIVGVVGGVLAAPWVLLGAVALLTSGPDSYYADTSAEATCSVEGQIRGSTTTAVVPLETTGRVQAPDGDWYIRNVVPLRSTNAVVSTKQFIGAGTGGALRFDVRPLIPGLPYSIDGIRVDMKSGDDWHSDVLRLAMSSDDAACEVGLGTEIPSDWSRSEEDTS